MTQDEERESGKTLFSLSNQQKLHCIHSFDQWSAKCEAASGTRVKYVHASENYEEKTGTPYVWVCEGFLLHLLPIYPA